MNGKGFILFAMTSLLLLTACGVLEVGVEYADGPSAEATASPTLTVITREVTRVADVAPPTLPVATPTPTVLSPTETLEPRSSSTPTPRSTVSPTLERSAVQVAFVKEGKVWLWSEDQGAQALTGASDVSNVRISDDGQIVAFVRGLELWAVNTDGTGERTLVSVEDIAAMVEPGDPGVRLHDFAWVPGTHVVAFNTRAHLEIGLKLHDDLHLVDADTLTRSILLPRGEGGQFTYAPDGNQIAVVRSGTVTVVDADGGNPREALTYTPPVTYSEFWFYAQPVWAADSRSLRVAIPPADPLAQPPQLTTVWYLYTDGRPARLLGTINARSLDQHAFSPDLGKVAYVGQSGGASPGSDGGPLLVTDLDSLETVTYHPEVGQVYGWSPDSERFAFLLRAQHPQAYVGRLGSEPVPVHGDPEVATIDARWLDTDRTFYTVIARPEMSLVLADTAGSSTVVASVTGHPMSYDYCLCGRPE